MIKDLVIKVWWHLPLSREKKEALKGFVFSNFGPVFRRSRAYRNWQSFREFSATKGDAGECGLHTSPGSADQPSLSLRGNPVPGTEPLQEITSMAVVVHVHYPGLLNEILSILAGPSGLPMKLYVSATPEAVSQTGEMLTSSGMDHQLFPCENRGRDVLPFLQLAGQVIGEGHQLILKLHTKRSDHRLTGDLWRKDLLSKLFSPGLFPRIADIFNPKSGIGMVGPAGHIVPMKTYYGENIPMLKQLSERMGLLPEETMGLPFVAGSMFYIRSQALSPLLNLNLGQADFEDESGQQDGTMAHAVERVFAMSNHAAELKLADTRFLSGGELYEPNPHHPYTW